MCVTALVALGLGAPGAGAGRVTDVAATCLGLLSPDKVHRGTDASLVGNWIVLPSGEPRLAQVLDVDAETVTIRRLNLVTMTNETSTVPRPRFIRRAGDVAYAEYDRVLARAAARANAEAEALVGKVVRLGGGIGAAAVLNASPRELDIEYVDTRSMEVRNARITRPAHLDVVEGAVGHSLGANARRVSAIKELRTGTYLFWTPNAPASLEPIPSGRGRHLRLQYSRPIDLPHQAEVSSRLQRGGRIHVRVGAIDLVRGTVELTTLGWTAKIPLDGDVLERSRFAPSPVGQLDGLARHGQGGFRKFRQAFLYGELKPGTAVVAFTNVGGDPLGAPRELIQDMKYYRIHQVGADFVIVTMGDQAYRIEGARNLAHLSLRVMSLSADANLLVSNFEILYRLKREPIRTYGIRPTVKRPANFEVIARELGALGLKPAQIEHYAGKILDPKKPYFWSGGGTPAQEWKFLMVTLHASKLTSLSSDTQKFANEVFAHGSAAARELKGFSERRSK